MDVLMDAVVFDVLEIGEPLGRLGFSPACSIMAWPGAVHVDGCTGRRAVPRPPRGARARGPRKVA